MNVAETILQQLGGRKFIAMTGARHLVGDDKSLMFTLPANFAQDGINKVRITLNWQDTYDLEFFHVRGAKVVEVARVTDVYNDQLREVFTRYTGLDTHL